MWYFVSPEIVYGADALFRLEELVGERAFVVTDPNVNELGLVELVLRRLEKAGITCQVFAQVESDPTLQTVCRCAEFMAEFEPDWIVGLGGGSCIDAAKAAWLLYERPDVDPGSINPFDHFGLRAKARLIAIPTTSGTGAEVTLATVLTDTHERRKLGLGSRELVPDIAIVDPSLVLKLPPHITAYTGLDALTHAVEGYTSNYHNDFCDGLCLKAIQLILENLPRAYVNGADADARERVHNAATIAGLGFGNSMTALAHALGHALGAVFHLPHGQAVSLALPYTIEFCANARGTRYAHIARALDLPASDELNGASSLVAAIRELQRTLDQPASLRALGISSEDFEANIAHLERNAESDTSLVMSTRVPDMAELELLFRCVYEARLVDF